LEPCVGQGGVFLRTRPSPWQLDSQPRLCRQRVELRRTQSRTFSPGSLVTTTAYRCLYARICSPLLLPDRFFRAPCFEWSTKTVPTRTPGANHMETEAWSPCIGKSDGAHGRTQVRTDAAGVGVRSRHRRRGEPVDAAPAQRPVSGRHAAQQAEAVRARVTRRGLGPGCATMSK